MLDFLRRWREEKTPSCDDGVLATRTDGENVLKLAEKEPEAKAEGALWTASGAEKRRAQAWWDAQMKRAQRNGMFVEFTTITPALAELMLGNNPDNRKLSQRLVQALASDMKGGRWQSNGEAIVIAATGELNDGQHRLNACVLSGCNFDSVVVFGASRESRTTLDQGKRRTPGDVLAISGYVDTNHLAHAARIVFQMKNFKRISKAPEVAPTAAQTLETVEENPRLIESLPMGRRAGKAKLGSIGTFTGLHYVCRMKSATATEEFFEVLTSALGFKGKTDPIYLLHKRLVEGDRLRETERAALLVKAWNAWRTKDSIRQLKFVPGESFPEMV
jgi:hypothetical protein